MRVPLALVVASLLLSGCSSQGPGPEPSLDAAETEGSTDQPAPMLAVAQQVPPSLGHCRIARTAANAPFGAGANLDTALFDDVQYCSFSQANASLAPFQSARVEVAWDGLQNGETEIHLRLDTSRCGMTLPPVQECNEGTKAGATSPLTLDLDARALQRNAGEDLSAYVYATGLSLTHDFHVYITLFPDTIPDGYTAVPA